MSSKKQAIQKLITFTIKYWKGLDLPPAQMLYETLLVI